MRYLISLFSSFLVVNGYKSNYLDERDIIKMVNQETEIGWIAGKNEMFANSTFEDLRQSLGLLLSKKAPHDIHAAEREVFAEDINDYAKTKLPKHFDARKKWPSCAHVIRDQKQCGSCWAFGAAESLSDRFCIAGHDLGQLSPQFLVSCDSQCMGCNGGTLAGAWNFLRDTGTVTNKCQPYESGKGQEFVCKTVCEDKSLSNKRYHARNSYAVVTESDLSHGRAVARMKAEVFHNGPLELGFTVMQDFYSYKGGVYHYRYGPVMGGHAVKLLGWGPGYWIIANSWGYSFGEHGTFRIRMGTNEVGIESNVWAGQPAVHN